jgi:hypothetical protein
MVASAQVTLKRESLFASAAAQGCTDGPRFFEVPA